MYFSPGVASGGFGRDAREQQPAGAGGRALVLPEFGPECVLQEVAGCAAAVGEELFERDGLVLRVHRLLQLGERLAERLSPLQFPLVDEDAAEHGGHRLGVRADVEPVRSGDLLRLAARAARRRRRRRRSRRLRTTATAMPGTSCFWMTGASSGGDVLRLGRLGGRGWHRDGRPPRYRRRRNTTRSYPRRPPPASAWLPMRSIYTPHAKSRKAAARHPRGGIAAVVRRRVE